MQERGEGWLVAGGGWGGVCVLEWWDGWKGKERRGEVCTINYTK
jgi:hypothetical protein